MDAPTVAAVTAAGVALGGGLRWLYESRRAKRREPVDEMSITAQASKAIAEASAALIIPLQQQLAYNAAENAKVSKRFSDKINALEAVVAALKLTESECRDRLAALESKVVAGRLTALEDTNVEQAKTNTRQQATNDRRDERERKADE